MRHPIFPLVSIILLFSVTALAQQNNQWIFGNHAGIDFNTGTAIPFYNSKINALEGCASVCDASGNLLFFTDGLSVWDKNNQLMPNGTGLGGGSSSTTTIVLQRPGNCTQYYLFTTQDHTQPGNFYYSVIDMCLNNGNGDVVNGSKKILIQTSCSEKIALIANTNGTDYWLITHELSNNHFNVYSITAAGIGAIPVSYNVGSSFDYNCQSGYLKPNKVGDKIAVATFWVNICEVVDFDPSTGIISNPINFAPLITSNPSGLWYGLEFSPNEKFLYATRAGFSGIPAELYQINIADSSYSLLSSAAVIPVDYYYGALRLAADGKIYMAKSTSNYIAAINYPDSSAVNCGYTDSALQLSPSSSSQFGLPSASVFPSVPYSLSLGNDTSLCSSYTLALPRECDLSFLWQDGSTDSSFTITSQGTYWVEVSSPSCGNYVDSIIVTSGLAAQITGDTGICEGDSTTLIASAGLSYLWSNGATVQSIIVQPSISTTYWVVVNGAGCSDSVSTTVNVYFPPKVYLFLDKDTVCSNSSPITLTGNPPGGTFSGDGVTNNQFDPSSAGEGIHTLTYSYSDANGCSAENSKNIFVELCTGTGSLLWDDPVLVFPTLFENDLYLSLVQSESVTGVVILNPLGQICITQNVNSHSGNSIMHIRCTDLSAGMYYVVVETGSRKIIKKVIKL